MMKGKEGADMTGAEFKRFLRKHKCKLLRHGSSHDRWINKANGKIFTVPRHDAQEMKKGLVEGILKQAGIE